MPINKKESHILLVLLFAVSVLAFFMLRPFLIPVTLAAIFATLLYPLHRRIRRDFKGWNGFSAFLTVLFAVLCVLIPLAFIGTRIVSEARQAYSSVSVGNGGPQQAILAVGNSLEPIIPGASRVATNAAGQTTVYFSRALTWSLGHAGTVFSSALQFALSLFIFLLTLFFLLKDGESVLKAIIKASPLADKSDERILARLALTVNSVVKGTLTVAFIQGCIAFLGFTIFGVPNAILWGTLAAFSALIPGVGTSLVVLPAIAFLFLTGHPGHALGLLLWGLVAVGMIDNFLGPRLVSRGVEMPQLVIMLSVLGGVSFFGPAGIFLGPLIVSLLAVLFSIFSESEKTT